jgi:hypothetical protein
MRAEIDEATLNVIEVRIANLKPVCEWYIDQNLRPQLHSLVTQQQAADLRGVRRQRINQLVNQGRIRSAQVGNQLMLLKADVVNCEVRNYTKRSFYWKLIKNSERKIGERKESLAEQIKKL